MISNKDTNLNLSFRPPSPCLLLLPRSLMLSPSSLPSPSPYPYASIYSQLPHTDTSFFRFYRKALASKKVFSCDLNWDSVGTFLRVAGREFQRDGVMKLNYQVIIIRASCRAKGHLNRSKNKNKILTLPAVTQIEFCHIFTLPTSGKRHCVWNQPCIRSVSDRLTVNADLLILPSVRNLASHGLLTKVVTSEHLQCVLLYQIHKIRGVRIFFFPCINFKNSDQPQFVYSVKT